MSEKVTIMGQEFEVDDEVYAPYYSKIDDSLLNLTLLKDCKSVLDMGTGTGVLALSWARLYPQIKEIIGVDKNPEAIKNAQKNLERLKDKLKPIVSFQEGNLFEPFKNNNRKKFDAIIFNGPHVDRKQIYEKEKRTLGAKYCALYDSDLKVATRFFEQVGDYLNNDGFIIYTFSDFGNLNNLVSLINDNGWIMTFASVVKFLDRDVSTEKLVSSYKVPLWYNLLVKRRGEDALSVPDDISKITRATIKRSDLSDISLGMRESLTQIYHYYSMERMDETLYDEFLKRILQINRIFVSQLSALLPQKEWLTTGMSFPRFHLDNAYRLFFAFGSGINKPNKKVFEKTTNAFAKEILETGLDENIRFILDYLSDAGEDAIESILKNEFNLDTFYDDERKSGRNKRFFTIGKANHDELIAKKQKECINALKCFLSADKEKRGEKITAARNCFIELAKQIHATVIDRISEKKISKNEELKKVLCNLILNYLMLKIDKKDLKYTYFEKKITPRMSEPGVFCLFSSLNLDEVDDFRVQLRQIFHLSTTSLQSLISAYYHFYHSLRSAIAAIMSRNGSHNIGSHVIYNVIKDIDMLNVQDNKYLFKYLQQRMDFVAQISTGWVPEWTSSSWLVKELMKGFFEQAHVLNYIAKSEGLQVHVDPELPPGNIRKISKHVFKCKKGKNKRDLIIQIELGDDGSPQTEGDEASGGAKLDEDVPVAVPGGNIGFHAFYTIIENFIRNAAKHEFSSLPDKFKKRKNLRVNIEIEEDEDRKAYTVRLWDNLSYISNVMSHNEETDDNPFKIDDKNSNKIENNNENFFNDLKLREYFTKLIVIKADEQVLKISAKDVQLEQLQTECKAISKNGGYYFIIHPYEKYGNKNELYRPCVIPRLSELIKNTNIRFVSQPRWESFLSGFNEKDKGKTEEKLKGLFEDNWLPIHCKINNEFAKDLINEDGSLRRESWGLSEMRISAGYLQKKEIIEVGNGKRLKETKFIEAIAIPELVNEDEQDVRAYRLGYKFKLLKPKEVLIVGLDSDDLYNEDNRNFLEKESIFLRKNIDFLDDFDFEFIVIVGDEVEKFCKLNEGNKHEFLEKFPYRIILVGNSNAVIFEKGSFLSKRIAVCKEDALVGKKLPKYLSDAISTKKVTQSENENSKEITPLETLKLMVYEKWVEHLKCVRQGKDSSEDVYLVVKTNEGRNPDKIDPDFKEFFSILEKRPLGLTLNINKKKKLKKAIRQAFGFYNKAHKPRTLPEELFDLKSGDVAGKPLACSFNSKLNKLSLDSLEDFRGKYHDNAISYLRHKPLCEELQCSPPHNPIYDENISGGANHFPIVANIPPENVNPYIFRKMLLKLIENGLFKIAIADERCLDYLAERSSLAGELTRCGVYPVKQVLSYMESPALEESCKIIAIDQDDDGKIKITYEKEFAPDAIIIHQGILDKINWGNYNYEDQEQFLIQLKEKIPFLAITSGRGEPPNLPKAAKFMGFSIIEQHILSDPHSKLLLTDSFMKLSRGGEA